VADFSRTPTDFVSGSVPAAAAFDGLAGGINAAEDLTSSVGSITGTEVTLISRDFTALASRTILIIGETNIESTVADDVFRIRIKEGSTNLGFRDVSLPVANRHNGVTVHSLQTAFSAGSHTITLTAERVAGTGTGQATLSASSPAILVIVDLGPNS
jgi:hypothetical protein